MRARRRGARDDDFVRWIVYTRPAFPGRFFARRWVNNQASAEVVTAARLDDLRAMLPPGLTCIPAGEGADEGAIETWV